jgi:hypothetical protein
VKGTASRANLELDFLLRLGKAGIKEFLEFFEEWWTQGEDWAPAQLSHAQRAASSTSLSPSRSRK